MAPEENKQAIARPHETATPDIAKKGSRGADFFPTMDLPQFSRSRPDRDRSIRPLKLVPRKPR
jgi:hypothetical protein